MMRQSTTVASATAAVIALGLVSSAVLAQPGGGFGIDPRAEKRTYHFEDTNEELPYCMFVSSKVEPDKPAPLIISLHGMGAPPDIMCNATAIDLAEEGGYILAAPMGYNTTGWFGSPVISMGGRRGAPPGDGARRGAPGANGPGPQGPGAAAAGRGTPPGGGRGMGAPAPENLDELSEKDVMNVLAMMKDEFNVDEDRIYLTGHSMGGAGTYFLAAEHADTWAAVAPVAPAAFMMTANREELLQKIADADLPIMVVHGDADEVVNVSISREQWVPTMEQLGMEYEYVEQPGITHGPVITSSQEDIFRFFDGHSK
jgi:poly(3-hydroxybutyrate) depolymerase